MKSIPPLSLIIQNPQTAITQKKERRKRSALDSGAYMKTIIIMHELNNLTTITKQTIDREEKKNEREKLFLCATSDA